MNVVLLLAFFFVVLGECGTLGSAKKSKSGKFTFEKRSIAKSNFQEQIDTATYLSIRTCPSYTCGNDSSYSSYCGGVCSNDKNLFQQVATKIQDCYVQGMCGIHLLSNQLTNINISIAPGSYPGACYISGQAVTMALTSQESTPDTPIDAVTPFYVDESLVYTFTGLNLHCQPAAPASSCTSGGSNSGTSSGGSSGGQNVGIPCCGNDLVTSLVCLVQQLLGSLGTQLNLLACNCYCGGRKRDVEGAIISKRQMASAVDSAVTVTQTEYFSIDYIFSYISKHAYLSDNQVETEVSFDSAIPSQYQADITAGIASAFNDYNVFYTLQNNFYETHYNLFFNFFKNTCNSCQ